MDTAFKYLIEHKQYHTWLCITGELTNSKDEIGLLVSKDSFSAETWLMPMVERYTYDFTGRVRKRCEMQDFVIYSQELIRIMLRKSGIDLWQDFIVTGYELNKTQNPLSIV